MEGKRKGCDVTLEVTRRTFLCDTRGWHDVTVWRRHSVVHRQHKYCPHRTFVAIAYSIYHLVISKILQTSPYFPLSFHRLPNYFFV